MPTVSSISDRPAGSPIWCYLATTNVDAAANLYERLFGWEADASGAEDVAR